MGANTFWTYGTGKTSTEAFRNTVEQARWEFGHGGYTGTIAEKNTFIEFVVPKGKRKLKYAHDLMDEESPVYDKRINDKYGPCGCIKIKPKTYLFFGWASA